MAKFKRKPETVDAVRLVAEHTMDTNRGQSFSVAGDWMVTGILGEQYPVPHEVFKRLYEPDTEEALEYWKKWRDWEPPSEDDE